MRLYVGIDRSTTFDVAVGMDAQGRRRAELRFEETPTGIRELSEFIRAAGASRHRDAVVVVEDPSGLLVQTLRKARYDVRVVHPVAGARYRQGLTPSGAKDDFGDAVVLADLARLEHRAVRPLPCDSAEVVALRWLTRAQWSVVDERRALQRQLRRVLRESYPAALAAFPRSVSSREALVTLPLVPGPAAAAHLRVRTLASALRDGSTCARYTADGRAAELLTTLRGSALRQPPPVEAAAEARVTALVTLLRCTGQVAENLEQQAVALFKAHHSWPIYSSFPGLSGLVGARILAELGDDPNRFATARGLLAFAGTRPVTRSSGQNVVVRRRTVYNRRLGAAVHLWIPPLIKVSPAARSRYDHRREQGDRHAAAARNVGGYYLDLLYRCLRDDTVYDEAAAAQHAMAIVTRP